MASQLTRLTPKNCSSHVQVKSLECSCAYSQSIHSVPPSQRIYLCIGPRPERIYPSACTLVILVLHHLAVKLLVVHSPQSGARA